jgi:hypothetical protein
MPVDIPLDAICICSRYKDCEVGDRRNPSAIDGNREESLDKEFGIERCALKYGIMFKHLNGMRQRIVDRRSTRTCCWQRRYRVKVYDGEG